MARKRTKQDDDSRELLTRSGPRVVWAPPDVVVGTHTFAGLRLQAATCGELLGRLLGRVQHGTPYLRAEAVSWISAMLCDFLDFEFVGAGWFGRDRRGPIRDSPLDSIEVYARHWIQGEHLQSPALQSHALGMLEFVQKHLRGEHVSDEGGTWKLEPAQVGARDVAVSKIGWRWFFDEPTYKREFTQRFCHSEFLLRIPEGAEVLLPDDNARLRDGELRFLFERCHLSTSFGPGFPPPPGFSVQQPGTEYDLLEGYAAYGAIPFGKAARWGLMPLSWVIGELAPARSADPAFTPLPAWVRADTARTVPAVSLRGLS